MYCIPEASGGLVKSALHFEGPWNPPRGVLEASGDVTEASGVPPGGVLGEFGGLLGGSWEALGELLAAIPEEMNIRSFLEESWGRLGGVLGPSWGHLRAILEPSWGRLGASWGLLGLSWGLLGPSWGHLGGIWGVLRAKPRK